MYHMNTLANDNKRHDINGHKTTTLKLKEDYVPLKLYLHDELYTILLDVCKLATIELIQKIF